MVDEFGLGFELFKLLDKEVGATAIQKSWSLILLLPRMNRKMSQRIDCVVDRRKIIQRIHCSGQCSVEVVVGFAAAVARIAAAASVAGNHYTYVLPPGT